MQNKQWFVCLDCENSNDNNYDNSINNRICTYKHSSQFYSQLTTPQIDLLLPLTLKYNNTGNRYDAEQTLTQCAHVMKRDSLAADFRSLEFIAETRILAEMKIENHGKIYFPWKKIDKHTFFSMKIMMMDL